MKEIGVNMEEVWKPIKGYEGLYEISNMGRVKSLAKIVGNGFHREEKMLQIIVEKTKYCFVNLMRNAKPKKYRIHLLVWDYFGDKPRDGLRLQVDHKDEDKGNNRIDNLQLLSGRKNKSKERLLNKASGLPTGVCWHKQNKKYHAQIYIDRTHFNLGFYNTPEEASNAYQEALRRVA